MCTLQYLSATVPAYLQNAALVYPHYMQRTTVTIVLV